jgi:ABC-type Zn uptake system ZnuABC Zn-binding protein ZnuA
MRTSGSSWSRPLSRSVVSAVLLSLTFLAGCGSSSESSGTAENTVPPLRVVTTVSPLTSIVANIAGAGVEVTGLVPEGVNSHTFEPPPSAARALGEADIVFVNGLGLEDPTEDLARANLSEGAEVVKLGDEILPRDEWIFDFSFPRSGGKPNPHLWTNPPMVKAYANVVRDALVRHHPQGKATYDANLQKFETRVDALDQAMADATRSIPEAKRVLLTYHDAYAYFADHYGWKILGAIQPSDFAEPSPRDVAELIDQIKANDVPVVFGSEVFPSPVLEQISAETGARYVDDLRDDDLPGEPGDQAHSWLGLMRLNYVTIVDAFGGDTSALEALDVSDVTADHATYPQ